jgi:hypothetical protein
VCRGVDGEREEHHNGSEVEEGRDALLDLAARPKDPVDVLRRIGQEVGGYG